MKILLLLVVIGILINVVRSFDNTKRTIQKAKVISQSWLNGQCRKVKDGKYSCRCGKKNIAYDRDRQVCIDGKVVQRNMNSPSLLRKAAVAIRRSTRDENYPRMNVGLQRKDNAAMIPLQNISAEAWLHLYTADVTLTQIYLNQENTSIEAIYVFPIEEKAAIYEFTAQIDDRLIKAVIKEKQEAESVYADTIKRNQSAALLRQNENTLDTFKINIGMILPGKQCVIKICYVTELNLINDNSIRFVVPTTIAPRYDPRPASSGSSDDQQAKYIQNVPYSMSFRAHIDRGKGNQLIETVTNMSHPVNVSMSYETIDVSSEDIALDRDIILDMDLCANRSAILVVGEKYENASKLAILTILNPDHEDFTSISDGQNPVVTTTEFIFLIDCSGSMAGENRISLVRDAMFLFIRSLPVGVHFNIIRFGSTYQILFNSMTSPMTVVYDESTAKQAEEFAHTLQANLGGTKLLAPLKYLKDHSPAHGRSRQVFVLTDGEISNTKEVIELCRSMSSTTRIFSFGLGRTPSRALVKGLARATYGHFTFVPPSSTVDQYVGIQLRRALQPALTDARLQWVGLWPRGSQAPQTTPPVYAKDRVLVYTLFENFNFHGESALVDFLVDKRRIGNALLNRDDIDEGNTIRRLAAKALIQELLHRGNESSIGTNMTIKQRIIALSLTHQILSPYTAFIGIETSRGEKQDPSETEQISVEISEGDDQLPPQSSFIPEHQLSVTSPPIQTPPSLAADPADDHLRNHFEYGDTRDFAALLGSDGLKPGRDHATYPPTTSPTTYSTSTGVDMQPSGMDHSQRSTAALDFIRKLVQQQSFNGVWVLTSDQVKQLTGGKQWTDFISIVSQDKDTITTALVIVLLESHYVKQKSLWFMVVDKARRRLIANGLSKVQTEALMNKIRYEL